MSPGPPLLTSALCPGAPLGWAGPGPSYVHTCRLLSTLSFAFFSGFAWTLEIGLGPSLSPDVCDLFSPSHICSCPEWHNLWDHLPPREKSHKWSKSSLTRSSPGGAWLCLPRVSCSPSPKTIPDPTFHFILFFISAILTLYCYTNLPSTCIFQCWVFAFL